MNYFSTTASISELLNTMGNILSDFSVESPRTEAILIISNVLEVTRTQMFLNPDTPVSLEKCLQISDIIKKRSQGYPLQYLLGEVEFYNSLLKVTPDVLIPRPETELLVDTVLQDNSGSNLKVCDIGTGSGAIAIALKKARPEWLITATDISPAALQIARLNAKKNECRIDFLISDLFSQLADKYDIIISNPPYISEAEYAALKPELYHEPKLALTAPENGLYFYQKIFQQIPDHLKLPAILYLEIGATQSREIKKLAVLSGADSIKTHQDLNDFDRFMTIKYT